MRIIPAIDIIDGKCVRLSKGDYNTKKVYNEHPLEVAKQFEYHGIQYLHLVDLDGAKSKHIVNYKVLEQIAGHTSLKIDFGGGIKSEQDILIAFNSGAGQITGGSIAVEFPEIFLDWLNGFGAEKIILGADYNLRKIAINGWLKDVEIDVIDFIKKFENQGIKYVIGTDISKDGMLAGASEDIYTEILSKTKISLIASGGISNIADVIKMKSIGCEGTIIGKAIYEGRISLQELSKLC